MVFKTCLTSDVVDVFLVSLPCRVPVKRSKVLVDPPPTGEEEEGPGLGLM